MSRIRRAARSAARSGRWKIGVYIRLSREDKKAEENRGQSRGGGNAGVGASGSVVEQDKILTEWVTDYFRNEDYELLKKTES